MDFELYLEGKESLPDPSWFSIGNLELPRVGLKIAPILDNREFNREEADRWVTFLAAIQSDFQLCNVLIDIFIHRNHRGLCADWIAYLFEKDKDRAAFIFKDFKKIAKRIADSIDGLDQEAVKKILQLN